MNWIVANFGMIFTVALIVFIGIPFLIVMVIPTLIFLGGKKNSKWFPSFDFLVKYFEVDVSKPPYSEWMGKHPLIFVGMTSIELYVSYYLIHLLKGIKWVVKKFFIGIYKVMRALVTMQWKKYEQWDKEFDEEEKKRKVK